MMMMMMMMRANTRCKYRDNRQLDYVYLNFLLTVNYEKSKVHITIIN